MMTNRYGEMVLSETDLFDLAMQGRDITGMRKVTVASELDIEQLATFLENPRDLLTWTRPEDQDISVPEFDLKQRANWYMPEAYKTMDIAEHVLSLCRTDEQLQRVGQELLLYQQHDLLDLLRYLRFLVDIMRDNHVIWGVGRGSSVASYVLYLLGVHKIDSLYYGLDVTEFLR